MQAIIYPIIFIGGLLVMACQKPHVDYDTAFKSCMPDTLWRDKDKNKETGYVGLYYANADCILGAQLPDFTSATMDGKKIDKDYFSGKISIINFWFIGCHPCEDEMPVFNRLVEKYKLAPVNFLAIGINSPKDITEFLTEHPFNFEHIAYGEPIIRGNFRSVWGYPITIVADQYLKIIDTERGLDDKMVNEKFIPVIDKALKRI